MTNSQWQAINGHFWYTSAACPCFAPGLGERVCENIEKNDKFTVAGDQYRSMATFCILAQHARASHPDLGKESLCENIENISSFIFFYLS